MSKGHSILRFFRATHLYLGIFTTPALLFFAFTGAMQSINLHESTPASDYKPPAWIVRLAQLHKKQNSALPIRRPARPAAEVPQRSEATEMKRDRPAGTAESPTAVSSAPNAAVAPRSPGRPVENNAAKDPARPAAPPQKSHMPMKIFFVIVALSLATSTLTGLYMSYKYQRRPWLTTGLLLAGLIIPLLLLPF